MSQTLATSWANWGPVARAGDAVPVNAATPVSPAATSSFFILLMCPLKRDAGVFRAVVRHTLRLQHRGVLHAEMQLRHDAVEHVIDILAAVKRLTDFVCNADHIGRSTLSGPTDLLDEIVVVAIGMSDTYR